MESEYFIEVENELINFIHLILVTIGLVIDQLGYSTFDLFKSQPGIPTNPKPKHQVFDYSTRNWRIHSI